MLKKGFFNQHLNALKRFPVENVVISIFVTSIQKSPIFITRPKTKKQPTFQIVTQCNAKKSAFYLHFFGLV